MSLKCEAIEWIRSLKLACGWTEEELYTQTYGWMCKQLLQPGGPCLNLTLTGLYYLQRHDGSECELFNSNPEELSLLVSLIWIKPCYTTFFFSPLLLSELGADGQFVFMYFFKWYRQKSLKTNLASKKLLTVMWSALYSTHWSASTVTSSSQILKPSFSLWRRFKESTIGI